MQNKSKYSNLSFLLLLLLVGFSYSSKAENTPQFTIDTCAMICLDTTNVTLPFFNTGTSLVAFNCIEDNGCGAPRFLDGSFVMDIPGPGVYEVFVMDLDKGDTCSTIVVADYTRCIKVECEEELIYAYERELKIKDVLKLTCSSHEYTMEVLDSAGTVLATGDTLSFDYSFPEHCFARVTHDESGFDCTTPLTLFESCSHFCPDSVFLEFPDGLPIQYTVEDFFGQECIDPHILLAVVDGSQTLGLIGDTVWIPPNISNSTYISIFQWNSLQCFTDVTNLSLAEIRGNVYRDENQNCLKDNGENQEVPNWIIMAKGATDTLFGYSNNQGDYLIYAPAGQYELEAIPVDAIWESCFDSTFIEVGIAEEVIVNVGLTADTICPSSWVQVNAPRMRSCFPNDVWIEYCNYGTETIDSGYVEINWAVGLILDSVGVPYTTIDNETIAISFTNLDPLECQNILLVFTPECDLDLGLAMCIEANMYPQVMCSENPLWSGANIEIEAICDGNNAVFTITNTGTGDMVTPQPLIVIEDDIMLVNNQLQLTTQESLPLTFPANGSTYRVVVGQEIYHPFNSFVTSVIEACGEDATGGVSTGYVNSFPLDEDADFTSIDCPIVVSSYDPNDKAVVPEGHGERHAIVGDERLEYTIRFENTGNDVAYNVTILDTLTSNLDLRTIQFTGASHDYFPEIIGNVLRISFSDINLPDTSVSKTLAQGFVKFQIKPMPDLARDTRIENRAAIYFDRNEPIITNTTFLTIGLDLEVGTKEIQAVKSIEINPNPAQERIQVDLRRLKGQSYGYSVIDLQGRRLFSEQGQKRELSIDIKTLPSGMFLLQINAKNGERFINKFIKQ